MKGASFNAESSLTPAYYKQHAKGGMVNVWKKHCLHESGTRKPSFNVVGSKTAAYCNQHPEDGMVFIRCIKRCSHDS